jgi:putative chitobiose transport system permease protein
MNKRSPGIALVYYLLAGLLVMLAVGPSLWLANIALQPPGLGVGEVTPPGKWTLANFDAALRPTGKWSVDEGLMRPIINSVIVTVIQTVLNVVLAALAAYPLARMRFRGRGLLFMVILATIMVPEQVVVVPMFVTIVDLGLFDTLAAVIIPGAVTAFGIYLCRQAFLAIPLELEEAARMDGAGALRVWWHVMLPLARPTLATLAVFSMIGAWSNLLWPLIVLQDSGKHTLPVAIAQLLSVFGDNVRIAYAASLLALVPMVVAYIVMQRFLERGLMGGAVKG